MTLPVARTLEVMFLLFGELPVQVVVGVCRGCESKGRQITI